MATLEERLIPVSDLLLDPNNFRFQDETGYITANADRFHEDTVQDRASQRLRKEGLIELKNSILTNGFLAVERLVVRPYAAMEGKYVVVEGNRRLAALRWLNDDDRAGVDIPDSVKETISAVPVVVIDSEDDDSVYLSLMGIRHVGGIRQWGGYQRAKLVTELRDKHNLDSAEIGNRLGMSTQEVNRRYRAFKALEQMQHDEEFGDSALPSMYPIFHEAVSLPVVREWLGWSEPMNSFNNIDELHKFYGLIAPTDGDEDEPAVPAKITKYSEVRDLRLILPIADAKRMLFEKTRTLNEALAIAKAEEMAKSWGAQVTEAVAALNSIGALELKNMDADDLAEIKRLGELAQALLDSHTKLTA